MSCVNTMTMFKVMSSDTVVKRTALDKSYIDYFYYCFTMKMKNVAITVNIIYFAINNYFCIECKQ